MVPTASGTVPAKAEVSVGYSGLNWDQETSQADPEEQKLRKRRPRALKLVVTAGPLGSGQPLTKVRAFCGRGDRATRQMGRVISGQRDSGEGVTVQARPSSIGAGRQPHRRVR